MAKTLTIKGKTFEADYAGVGYRGMLKAQVYDKRPLSEIAPEVEFGEVITCTEDDHTDTFTGYITLNRIERNDAVTVIILLAREPVEIDDAFK